MAADSATACATPVQVPLLGRERLQVPNNWHTVPWHRANPVLSLRFESGQTPKELRRLGNSTGQQKTHEPIPLLSKSVKVGSAPRQSASGISVFASVRAVSTPTCNLRPGPLVRDTVCRDPLLHGSHHTPSLGSRRGSNAEPLTFRRPEDNHVDHLVMESLHSSSVATLLRGDHTATPSTASRVSRGGDTSDGPPRRTVPVEVHFSLLHL
eukprot:6491324-Amphidinium_carterae.2